MKLASASAIASALVSVAVAIAPATAWADSDGAAQGLITSPATGSGGSRTTFTFALTNRLSRGSSLASANLTAPPGFKLIRASLPPGTPGTAAVVGGVVQLRKLAVAREAVVHVTVAAWPPERCGTWSYAWRSAGKEEPDFTGHRLALGASHSSWKTTVKTACALVFAGQPHNAIVGQRITGTDYDQSGPPVTVEVVDAHGRMVASSTTPITIGLGNNPGNATLGGTATVDAAHGVASFSDLTLDKPANGYTLTASSPWLTEATSDSFDESNAAATCAQNVSCQVSITTNASVFSVTANPNASRPNAATLTESLDVGTPLECQGYTPADPSWFGFLVITVNRSKVITYTLKRVPAEVRHHAQFCLGAPYEFTTGSGKPAPQGILPDGEVGFIGLLPYCDRDDPIARPSWFQPPMHPQEPAGPCVASRIVTNDWGAWDVVLTIDIPRGLAGDPWGRL